MSENDQEASESVNPEYAKFMVLEGSDGTIYQIPLEDLQKYRVSDEGAKAYSRTRASSISCRIKCR